MNDVQRICAWQKLNSLKLKIKIKLFRFKTRGQAKQMYEMKFHTWVEM